MKKLSFSFLIVLSLVMLAAGVPAWAADDPINTDRHGVAIKGYDPVAYFTESRPVKGDPDITLEWSGATWRFSSEQNRELFKNDPEKYAPKYGGYCAYAVSQGTTADIDPDSWNIVDGTLYLNLNKRVQKKWLKDIPGYIKKADQNWPGIKEKLR